MTAELEREANEIAMQKFAEFMQTPEGSDWFIRAILEELNSHTKIGEFVIGARELLTNTVVMVWGAFEVFASDILTAYLNYTPEAAGRLLSDDRTKKHYSGRLSPDALEAFNFDVSKSMGTLLLGERGLDSLPVMRGVFQVLFPQFIELHRTAASDELWLLWQRRHLIVHKRGIVDVAYLKKTSDRIALGERLEITGDDVDIAFANVVATATSLARALTSVSSPSAQGTIAAPESDHG